MLRPWFSKPQNPTIAFSSLAAEFDFCAWEPECRADCLLSGLIHDWSGKSFEALPQRREPLSVAEKIAVAVGETRIRQRRHPRGRRHVGSRGISGGVTTLLLLA